MSDTRLNDRIHAAVFEVLENPNLVVKSAKSLTVSYQEAREILQIKPTAFAKFRKLHGLNAIPSNSNRFLLADILKIGLGRSCLRVY